MSQIEMPEWVAQHITEEREYANGCASPHAGCFATIWLADENQRLADRLREVTQDLHYATEGVDGAAQQIVSLRQQLAAERKILDELQALRGDQFWTLTLGKHGWAQIRDCIDGFIGAAEDVKAFRAHSHPTAGGDNHG